MSNNKHDKYDVLNYIQEALLYGGQLEGALKKTVIGNSDYFERIAAYCDDSTLKYLTPKEVTVNDLTCVPCDLLEVGRLYAGEVFVSGKNICMVVNYDCKSLNHGETLALELHSHKLMWFKSTEKVRTFPFANITVYGIQTGNLSIQIVTDGWVYNY